MTDLDWKSKLNLAYSTDHTIDENSVGNFQSNEGIPNKDQKLLAKLEKKGRGGKVVCLLEGFIGSDDELKQLAKALKTFCGTGGSVKDGVIIIQGNVRDQIIQYLKSHDYSVKRVGA